MEHTMNQKTDNFITNRNAESPRLALCGRQRNDEIAEEFVFNESITILDRRKRQYVGRLILTAVAKVENLNKGVVTKENANFALRNFRMITIQVA